MNLLKDVCCLTVMLFGVGLGLTDIASTATVVATEDYVYTVQLSDREKINEDRYRFTFRVHNNVMKQDSLIEMRNMSTDIHRIALSKDRLIVFGEVGSAMHTVTILDLKSQQEVDFLMCFFPELSETGRYLIYKRFYPRFSPPQVQSDLILIYDIQRPPEDNRMDERDKAIYKGIRKKTISIDDPEYFVASEYVGHPVYPEDNLRKRTYFVWVDPPEQSRLVVSKFLWLDQDTKVMFAEEQAGERCLVLLDLSQGLDKVTVKRRLLKEF